MMSSPLPTVAVSLSYICIAKVRSVTKWKVVKQIPIKRWSKILGPRLMRDRKAFNIEKIQLAYNTVHLLINVYLFKEAAVTGWFAGYSYRCQPADFANHGTPMRVNWNFWSVVLVDCNWSFQIATGCWWYYFSKFSDFFETFIFLLGKRYDLVNFYHVAHHSIMPVGRNCDITVCEIPKISLDIWLSGQRVVGRKVLSGWVRNLW